MKNRRKLFLIAGLFLLASSVLLFFPEIKSLFQSQKEVPYSYFNTLLEEGKIASVNIKENSLEFKEQGGDSVFKTENPSNPELKERLLLKDIKVKEEKSGTEIVSIFLDVLFYLIFFGIFAAVFVKFISPNTFKVVRKTGVKFSDIVGMDSLKSDLMQICKILKNPSEYAKKGIRAPKGILLEGAPGNGKTLFARALAGEANVNFIPAKATDFESMFMAIGPMKVKLLFKKARRRAPCIVFIDEFDGIGTRRNYSGSAIETENTRIVTALLNELDGFEKNNGIVVVAATNSRDALDEALIRPGRFDAKYTVPFPGDEERRLLIRMYTRGKNPASDVTEEKLSSLFKGFSCAQIESVLNRASLCAVQENRSEFTMNDIQSALREI